MTFQPTCITLYDFVFVEAVGPKDFSSRGQSSGATGELIEREVTRQNWGRVHQSRVD